MTRKKADEKDDPLLDVKGGGRLPTSRGKAARWDHVLNTLPYLGGDEGKKEARKRGPEAYQDVRRVLKQHFHLDEDWHYSVVAIFILQSRIPTLLPVVFYLFIGGNIGAGKTNLLMTIRSLTDGLLFENVSIAALARSMEHGRTVCLDEIDVARGREYDEPRDALLRNGYKAKAAPYTRYDPANRRIERVPVYGPKAVTLRGALDPALESRGFFIPMNAPVGEEGLEFVIANFWPQWGSAVDKLDAFEFYAKSGWSVEEEKLKELAQGKEFKDKLRRALPELGANRNSELGIIVTLVAEIAGIDVEEELRKATELSALLSAEEEGLEEMRDAVIDTIQSLRGEDKVAATIEIRQKNIKAAMNKQRKDRHEFGPISNQRFAQLRRALGVKDEWLKRPHNQVVWVLTQAHLEALRAGKLLGEVKAKGGW